MASVRSVTFDVRGSQTPPSKPANATIFWARDPWRSRRLGASVWNDDDLTFFLFPVTFPHALHASASSHKYAEPLPSGEVDLRFVLPSSCGAASWVNSSLLHRLASSTRMEEPNRAGQVVRNRADRSHTARGRGRTSPMERDCPGGMWSPKWFR